MPIERITKETPGSRASSILVIERVHLLLRVLTVPEVCLFLLGLGLLSRCLGLLIFKEITNLVVTSIELGIMCSLLLS